MKRLLFLLILTVMVMTAVITMGSTADLLSNIECVTLDTLTITAQHTEYGSWIRVCSTAAIIEANDSGYVLVTFSGTVTLPQGKSLYIGIDTLGSTVDTIWGMAKVQAPRSRTYSYLEVPFQIRKRILIDSTTGTTADTNMWSEGELDTIPRVVGTAALSGSSFTAIIQNAMLTTEFFYQGDN